MGSSPDTPTEDPAAKALRKRQAEQLLQLDEDTNTRVKRMFTASQGLRIARGSADSRLPVGNSTSGPGATDYGVQMSNERGYSGSGGMKSAKRARKRGESPGGSRAKPGI